MHIITNIQYLIYVSSTLTCTCYRSHCVQHPLWCLILTDLRMKLGECGKDFYVTQQLSYQQLEPQREAETQGKWIQMLQILHMGFPFYLFILRNLSLFCWWCSHLNLWQFCIRTFQKWNVVFVKNKLHLERLCKNSQKSNVLSIPQTLLLGLYHLVLFFKTAAL